MKFRDKIELELEIEYDYWPREPQTWNHPGCPEGVEICNIWLVDGKGAPILLPGILHSAVMGQVEDLLVELALDHAHEQSDDEEIDRRYYRQREGEI